MFAGVSNPSFQRRYLVLQGTTLSWRKNDSVKKPKALIDLREGRGVREKNQTHSTVPWPAGVSTDLCFAVATEKRTYYFVGEEFNEVQ